MPDLSRFNRALPRIALVLLAVAVTPAEAADAPPKFSQYAVKDICGGRIVVPQISAKKDPELGRAYREAKKTEVNAAGHDYENLKTPVVTASRS